MPHRGDFNGTTLLDWPSVNWDTMRALTEKELASAALAEAEVKAALAVCGNDPDRARKMLDNHRAVQAGQRVMVTKVDAYFYGEFKARIQDIERKTLAILAPVRSAGKRERKHFKGDVTATDTGNGTGVISGYLSTWGEDLVGDMIAPNAYDDTIAAAKSRAAARGSRYLWPILWNHDDGRPIGGWTSAATNSKGLYVRGELDLDTEDGKRAFSAIRRGYVDGLSIGYTTDKSHYVASTRVLDKINLHEGSVVTFPAQPETSVHAS